MSHPVVTARLVILGTLFAALTGTTTMAEPAIRVPSFTAYAEPNVQVPRISSRGVRPWNNSANGLAWYGKLNRRGELRIALDVVVPEGENVHYRMTVTKVGNKMRQSLLAKVAESDRKPNGVASLAFQPIQIDQTGYYRFYLVGLERTGNDFGRIQALQLSGAAVEEAHFNLEPRRNASSVHFRYPLKRGAQVKAFYNELTVETDPLWSYYMACGFHRGYFGIQVNSPTERRIIFSIWDSGNEAVDRGKVDKDNLVRLVSKGDRVVAHGFGNEGTGGHSHLVYPWKKGQTYRFLVLAEPADNATVFSGYFFFPEKNEWGLIASFHAPKDGGHLRGLYSFSENFVGTNGQKLRRGAFGNTWICDPDDQWRELTEVVFTHDPTGDKNRQDYAAVVKGDRVVLQHGGFLAEKSKKGDRLRREASGNKPQDVNRLINP
ncbi:MAG: DUF3472 domain-containing protein [Pirellulaceae bacterium]|nr:DUF3472 domain-containing protein [Planctomycetaceae bacterium]